MAYRYFATKRASSSSPTRRATSSTRATWSPLPPAATRPWCWSTSPSSTLADAARVAAADAPPRPAGAPLRRAGIVFAVNKIDGRHPGAALTPSARAARFAKRKAGINEVAGIVPVSALRGDNVTHADAAGRALVPTAPRRCRCSRACRRQERGRRAACRRCPWRREGEGTGNQPRTLWGRIAQGMVSAEGGRSGAAFPSGQLATVAEVRPPARWSDVVEAGSRSASCLTGSSTSLRADGSPRRASTPRSVSALRLAWTLSRP